MSGGRPGCQPEGRVASLHVNLGIAETARALGKAPTAPQSHTVFPVPAMRVRKQEGNDARSLAEGGLRTVSHLWSMGIYIRSVT